MGWRNPSSDRDSSQNGPPRSPLGSNPFGVVIAGFICLLFAVLIVTWFTRPEAFTERLLSSPSEQNNNNNGSEESIADEIYDDVEEELDDNPHNLENVEYVDDFNLETERLFSDSTEISPNTTAEISSNNTQNGNDNIQTRRVDTAVVGYRHSAYDVIGGSVYDSQDNYAGEIHDIIIEKQTGNAIAVVADQDDNLYENDLKAITINNVRAENNFGDIHMTVSENALESRQAFNYGNFDENRFISLKRLQNGKVLDFENKEAGMINAIVYKNKEAQRIYFTLDPGLTPEGEAILLSIPYDAINIVESNGQYNIVLSRKQTEALADIIY
jgi:sporulation protein YlmC with PRC-barrel domain